MRMADVKHPKYAMSAVVPKGLLSRKITATASAKKKPATVKNGH